MSSPFNLGQFVDSTNLAIQKLVKKESTRDNIKFKQYYNFRTTEDLIEKDSSISGLKEAEFTAENAEILEDVPVQGQKIEALSKFQLINGGGLRIAHAV